jgi:hypothetical protein
MVGHSVLLPERATSENMCSHADLRIEAWDDHVKTIPGCHVEGSSVGARQVPPFAAKDEEGVA